ncbi:UPF0481 protein At3g47200-like [Musa acuminata AAA Group]|uniref:UPF0481 protein At3g47200-like n=1 Tax=Musa acuminata AAA Group TaxID=214697 RepID=UPI0031E32E98
MMLLDGSFVIEIIISWVKDVSELNVGQNTIKNTIWSLLAVAQDMLLLENQLPFFLLDRLYDTAFPEDAGGQTELTQEFLRMFIMFMNDNERVPSHGGPDFHHILHLCHFCILPAKKPNDSDSDSFEQPNGKLEIPQLVVGDDTNVLFKNLTAFEQCSQEARTYLTAYASLVDCIINTAADVELLQKDQIIINTSGDNTEVANFFNKLCKDVLIKDEDYLTSIYRDVNKHCGIRYHIWWRTLHRDYFKNPWTIIWLCAAIFAFILTIPQTVYPVLGYIRPPK